MSSNGGAKMRMVSSCNGCRALRKGCSEDCTIRPCLEWITTPEAQANATVFLAKFYGRAGLLNLIAAAPGDHADADARPSVFRSLIYEACGRIVNPVYGAVGLLWSGEWKKCVDAVDAMFKGELGVPVDDVVQADVAFEAADAAPPLGARLRPSAAAYDIRHFAKDSDDADTAAATADLLRFARGGRLRKAFKRAGSSSSSSSNAKLVKGKAKGIAKLLMGIGNNKRASPSPPPPGQQQEAEELEPVPMAMVMEHNGGRDEDFAGRHDHHLKLKGSKENTDVEASSSHVIQAAEAEPPVGVQVLAADQEAQEEVGLELTLGLKPVGQ